MSTYNKKKGDFVWSKNVIPEYRWYNGKADYYEMGEKVDPTKTVALNSLSGNIKDKKAKITPFKVMRGKQIFDSGNNYMIVPKLFGPGGYWKTFDWDAASKLGMESVSLPYSGEFGFVQTEMYWPLNHMIAPAEKALRCTVCHTRKETKRLNWEALGYEGDPMSKGGRFKE
jgi:cytochrome c